MVNVLLMQVIAWLLSHMNLEHIHPINTNSWFQISLTGSSLLWLPVLFLALTLSKHSILKALMFVSFKRGWSSSLLYTCKIFSFLIYNNLLEWAIRFFSPLYYWFPSIQTCIQACLYLPLFYLKPNQVNQHFYCKDGAYNKSAF